MKDLVFQKCSLLFQSSEDHVSLEKMNFFPAYAFTLLYMLVQACLPHSLRWH